MTRCVRWTRRLYRSSKYWSHPMRLPLSEACFGFIMYFGLAMAQTPQPAQTLPVPSGVPATRSGGVPNKPEIPAPGTATPAPAGETGVQTPETQFPVNAMADSDLQSQIQTALSKEPTLNGD